MESFLVLVCCVRCQAWRLRKGCGLAPPASARLSACCPTTLIRPATTCRAAVAVLAVAVEQPYSPSLHWCVCCQAWQQRLLVFQVIRAVLWGDTLCVPRVDLQLTCHQTRKDFRVGRLPCCYPVQLAVPRRHGLLLLHGPPIRLRSGPLVRLHKRSSLLLCGPSGLRLVLMHKPLIVHPGCPPRARASSASPVSRTVCAARRAARVVRAFASAHQHASL